MKIRGETIFALVLLCAFVVIVGAGMGYSKKAKMLPLVLGIPGLILTTAIVVRESFSKRGGEVPGPSSDQETDAEVPDEQKKLLAMFGWVALLIAMIWVFGFLITIPVYMVLFLKARGEKWLLALCFAAGSWAFLYWIFAVALKIILYPGFLFE